MKEKPKRTGIMLANPATESAMLKLGDACFAQPKLNGERAVVEWFHGSPILLSSYGNEFKFLRRIKESIKNSFGYNQLELDGELYTHGWPREKIHSACSRKTNENPDVANLSYYIFDYKSDESQWQRIHSLTKRKNFGCFTWPLAYVPYRIINTNPRDWMRQVLEYTQEGYEGAIFRSALYSYEEKRSRGLLKFKPNETDTYNIVDVLEAISQEGEPKNMVGAFLVCGDDMTQFKVGAGKLNHSERTKLWEDRKTLVGKELLVKHELIKTVNGIPLCAVAVKIIP